MSLPEFLRRRDINDGVETCRATPAAYSMLLTSPMTRGRQRWYREGSDRALTVISGPFPKGSPIVMPRMGFSM